MITVLFSVLAAGVLLVARAQQQETSWAWKWLATLLCIFLVVRITAYFRSHRRLCEIYIHQYDGYQARYGDTSFGKQFLDRVPLLISPVMGLRLLQGLFTHHWTPAIKESIAVLLNKPEEQRAAEASMAAALRAVETSKSNVTTSLYFTGTVYLVAFFASVVAIAPEKSTPENTQAAVATPRAQQRTPVQQRTTEAESQKIAVQRYPQLGVAGSSLNTQFLARYNLYRRTRPDFFKNPSWPIALADEIAATPK